MRSTEQNSGILRVIAENLATGALVYLSAMATWAAFASDHTAVSPIWPAGGVALAAALLLGWRVAPGILASLFFGSAGGGNAMVFSIAAPAGIVASLYFGRWLLCLRGFDHRLGSTRDILLLAGFGAIVPSGISGFWIAGCLAFTGAIGPALIAPVGLFYWIAYAAGAIVLAPVILLIASGRFFRSGGGSGGFLAGLFQILLVGAASAFAFHGFSGDAPAALAYLPFPFVVWVALSRGLCGAALAVLVCVGIAVLAASLGSGPFISEDPLSTFWQLEAFIAIMVGSGLLIGAGSDAQRREKVLQAEAATRKAELERLKAQVNPHFLFNCLTAIQSLVRTDSAAAGEGLGALSSLLRKSLDVAKHPLIPLGEELEIIRDALRLQKMRYEEGLEWSVGADKEAEEFRVPPMILQPLVENAVKHGVCDGFGRVDVNARVEGGALVVLVRNTAPPGCDPALWPQNVGLAGVRARIAESCGSGSSIEFSRTSDGWIQALVRIRP